MASRTLHLFSIYFVMIGLTIHNIRGQDTSAGSGDLSCATKNAAADGSDCVKVVGPVMEADNANANCGSAESGAVLYRPKSKSGLATAWTNAMIAYIAANPDSQPCLEAGPLWTAWNDKTTEAGADGNSTGWVLPDGTTIDTTDLASFWMPSFPVADIPPVEFDCVAAIAIDGSVASTPEPQGGLMNMPCTSSVSINASALPTLPGGLSVPSIPLPDLSGALNQSSYCALCSFPQPTSDDASGGGSSSSTLQKFNLFKRFRQH